MPVVSSAFAKNVIRRAFSELVDPGPDKSAIEAIWKHFDGKCAYCDKALSRGMKEAHIDHLVSASVGGPNHISNRVLACATCNEKEKRDADWQEFLERKVLSPEELAARTYKINSWQLTHGREQTDEKAQLLSVATEAAAEVIGLFDQRFADVRNLKRETLQTLTPPSSAQPADTPAALSSNGRRASDLPVPKARYEFSRLCFKADVIEALDATDHFRVDTPDGSFQMSRSEFYEDFLNVVESASYREAGIYHYPMPPQHTTKYLILEGTSGISLEIIIDKLARHHQRATYGAVSSIVGRIARSLMQRQPRVPRNSWIVSQSTGLPTAYSTEEMDPHLRDNAHVIRSSAELSKWLQLRS